jgi:hypothetical protein
VQGGGDAVLGVFELRVGARPLVGHHTTFAKTDFLGKAI